MKNICVLLFEDFETLDAFGPVEIFGHAEDLYAIRFYSLNGDKIGNKHGVSIFTNKPDTIEGNPDIFLIPGGPGTRKEVNNKQLIEEIKRISTLSRYVLTVCTGSALLAKTGLLDGKKATSNKRAFDWVITNGKNVFWDRKARWTVDDKYYTSSGISAGMDMTLGFLSDHHGIEFAAGIAKRIEYHWIENEDDDSFTAE